jgi:hypothetical protein
MCEFFSFVTKGDGVPMYFDEKLRKQIYSKKLNYENPDSHTSIADYHGYKGVAEDKLNKYEYSPFTKKLVVDNMGGKNDEEAVRNWCKSFDFSKITSVTKIKGWLYLSGCDLKGITLPKEIGGSLYLSGCDLKGITLPEKIGGSLDLSGCDLKGITLPEKIGGSLDLSGCDLKGITLPKGVNIYK